MYYTELKVKLERSLTWGVVLEGRIFSMWSFSGRLFILCGLSSWGKHNALLPPKKIFLP